MERHLLWTLPDPVARCERGGRPRPAGGSWPSSRCGADADPLEALRARAWTHVRRWRGTAPDHHGPYPDAVRGALPLGTGTHPRAVAGMVAEAGWVGPRLVRLRDVEWASTLEQRLPERLLGVTPRFAVVAGDRSPDRFARRRPRSENRSRLLSAWGQAEADRRRSPRGLAWRHGAVHGLPTIVPERVDEDRAGVAVQA